MKFLIVFVALFALAVASPVDSDANAYVINQEANVEPDGFSASFETSNGIKEESSGHLQNQGSENEGIAVRGSFSYPAPDGSIISLTYVADENGFQPEGAHLPVAPEA
ncbi:larval cuticle protein 65Ag1-like [Drosophila sulfurigaster albostrigata]|uniref:larval cuticle protein 65Ag1-like n=1 Tax=Drosophila sulfurigaster albostrigata TaxID=89887 RepID=UPI002D2182FD|nr:larval cuticle protein 65Ag1-like [Drosophila sulfurigaster albostrigata]